MPGHATARLRLTAWYAALFLASGAALPAITYGLVSHATAEVLRVKSGTFVAGPPSTGLPGPGQRVRAYAASAGAAENDALLLYSGVALAIMTVISGWLGWFAAGWALRPLEASYEAQRQFVANASHELRTPLTRSRTLLEVALRPPDAPAETLRAACERALAADEEQERLITALLILARGQHGLIRRDPLDLAALTRGLLAARGATMASRGLSVEGHARVRAGAGRFHSYRTDGRESSRQRRLPQRGRRVRVGDRRHAGGPGGPDRGEHGPGDPAR
jgi:signal transduction histidine kinase